MNKLCCELNPLYYCGECDRKECKACWTTDDRSSHFKSFDDEAIRIKCRVTDKILVSGKTFKYYGD